ncbi:MAG: hypothetical protein WC243_00645 [Patescibacteria group bacterium]
MNERNLSCETAVLKTLSYRAVFRYPLSFFQLGTFLICGNPQPFTSLVDTLDALRKNGVLRLKKARIILKNVSPLDWEARARDSKKVIKSHQQTFKILGKIPWIRLLAITGATAAYSYKKGDDLDIFVVTQKNRLWITRFFVVLLLKALGAYRTDKSPSRKICPNLFISESELSWDLRKRDVYVAHEIIMMHPILDRGDVYFKFIKANDWIFKYFANSAFTFPKSFQAVHGRKSKVLDVMEVILMGVQKRYMKKKKTVEVTSRRMIHFNRDDSRQKTLMRFQKIYGRTEETL